MENKTLTPEEQAQIRAAKLEKRYNIDKWKMKKFTPNVENRNVVAQMRRDYQIEKANFVLENLYKGLGNLINLNVSQASSVGNMLQNIEVELAKLRKLEKKVGGE